jgi:hypothetical protein
MGIAVDVLQYCQLHGGSLTPKQREDLIAKFKARQIELEKEVAALQRGIAMLSAAPPKPPTKRKTSKRGSRR